MTTPKRNEAVAYDRTLTEGSASNAAAELAKLRAERQATLGVGDGTGKLFVHGSYESIKACQARLLEAASLQGEVSRLREALEHIIYTVDQVANSGDYAIGEEETYMLDGAIEDAKHMAGDALNLEPPTDGR